MMIMIRWGYDIGYMILEKARSADDDGHSRGGWIDGLVNEQM